MGHEFSELQLLVLELVESDDTPFATLARGLVVEDVQAAVRDLLLRECVRVERITELSPGGHVDKPVSLLTPDVCSTDGQSSHPLTLEEAEAVVSAPGNWRSLEAMPVREWFAVTTTALTMGAYRRAWEEHRRP